MNQNHLCYHYTTGLRNFVYLLNIDLSWQKASTYSDFLKNFLHNPQTPASGLDICEQLVQKILLIVVEKKKNAFILVLIPKVMEMKFENEHPAKCHGSVAGAACKVTPDTAMRQFAHEHFKVRFQDF